MISLMVATEYSFVFTSILNPFVFRCALLRDFRTLVSKVFQKTSYIFIFLYFLSTLNKHDWIVLSMRIKQEINRPYRSMKPHNVIIEVFHYIQELMLAPCLFQIQLTITEKCSYQVSDHDVAFCDFRLFQRKTKLMKVFISSVPESFGNILASRHDHVLPFLYHFW